MIHKNTSGLPILYFGTPVAIISTINDDGSGNLAPISSLFWLGWRCIIGIDASSQTTANLLHSRQCVVNLPSIGQADAVNLLAKTTGSDPVPAHKKRKGYRHVKNKFKLASLTAQPSETVKPARVKECPVQMEAILEAFHEIAADDDHQKGGIFTMELRITRVYVDHNILVEGDQDRVDPNKWKPLIMSFQNLFTLSTQVAPSVLSSIPEKLYKAADRERALLEQKQSV
jgi:flavin reductase (DIM6/NTAB) family NADH-FMN oxidoreductase RutF